MFHERDRKVGTRKKTLCQKIRCSIFSLSRYFYNCIHTICYCISLTLRTGKQPQWLCFLIVLNAVCMKQEPRSRDRLSDSALFFFALKKVQCLLNRQTTTFVHKHSCRWNGTDFVSKKKKSSILEKSFYELTFTNEQTNRNKNSGENFPRFFLFNFSSAAHI